MAHRHIIADGSVREVFQNDAVLHAAAIQKPQNGPAGFQFGPSGYSVQRRPRKSAALKKILQEEAVLLMRQHNFLSLFSRKKPILAMLHLRGGSRQEKYEHALLEAGQLIGGGADAVIVENYFGDYEDMETVLEAFSREKVDFVYGVNALHNDALGFELAKKYGAGFIQLDSVAGHLTPEEDASFGEAIAKWRAGYSGFVMAAYVSSISRTVPAVHWKMTSASV